MKFKLVLLTVVGLAAIFVVFHNFVSTESALRLIGEIENRKAFEFELPDSNLCNGIRLNLKSAIAIDNESHEVLYCYNADNIVPIASISKLITAMVVLDNYQPDSIISISAEDSFGSSRSIFRTGDQATVRDMLHASLIRSDNRATRALARFMGGTIDNFVVKVNEKIHNIGLENTVMYEPTGLDDRNRSTAADCAKLINHAMLYQEITRITSLQQYSFSLTNRKKIKNIVNTNKLVFSKYKILAGKTGYISESAYCLTTIIEDEKGKKVTVVVLGAPGPQTRFREARRLAAWAFSRIEKS
jgi:D-alanyl-D-alanine endopeptidase (penicillin-binding protein 7)